MAAHYAVTRRGGDGPLGAYRTVTMSAAKARWLTGVPENKKADLIPAGIGSNNGPRRPGERSSRRRDEAADIAGAQRHGAG